MEKRVDFGKISQEKDSRKEKLMESEAKKKVVLTDEELEGVTGAHLGWLPISSRFRKKKR